MHWSRRIRRLPWRWVPLATLVAAAFMLGYSGFQRHLAAAGQPKTAWDIAYLTVQLFFLESGAVDGPIGWQLQVARFLAPVVTAYAVVQAVLVLFAVQVQRTWLRWRGGHVVVCGLGRKGSRLVEELRRLGRRVIVIDHDPNNDDLAHCRSIGAVTIVGPAHHKWTLRKSHVHRADSLIAVTADDGTNVEIAVRAHELNRRRSALRGPLKCVVHVEEPRLRRLFQQHRIYSDPSDPFELELFNVFEVAARAMLREPPVLLPRRDRAGSPPHLLVVGMGRLGEALVRRVLKDWRIEHRGPRPPLRITIVDAHAAHREEQFRLRYPRLTETADLRFLTMDVNSADFAHGMFLQNGASQDLPDAAYLCLDQDSVAMTAALTVRQLLKDDRIPIVVRMSQEAGLATLFSTGDDGGRAIAGIRAVGLLDLTCHLEVVLGGPLEFLAHAIHQAYLYDQLAADQPFGSTPALVSWEQLDEGLKESNRQQARHVPAKLARIGCEMVPNIEDEIPVIEFTDHEIETLAEDEHRRWVEERLAAGWRPGPHRDHERKISPYLVPWEELPEEVREIDRQFARRLPANLAKADYEIRRVRRMPAGDA